jgi:hypothetical protein
MIADVNFHDLLQYRASDGALIWKQRNGMPSWNARFAGKVAGAIVTRRDGMPHCTTIRVHRIPFLAHRVVWQMFGNDVPDGYRIDHIDGNPHNNRIENLRLATNSQNLHNRPATRSSSTGIKGVYAVRGRYISKIKIRYKSISLGTFDTKGMAASAYAKASLRLMGKHSYYASCSTLR